MSDKTSAKCDCVIIHNHTPYSRERDGRKGLPIFTEKTNAALSF